AHRLHEQLLGVDGAVGLERHDQVRRDGGAQRVLAVAAGAVQVELFPPVVGRLVHRVLGGLVVGVAQGLVGLLGGSAGGGVLLRRRGRGSGGRGRRRLGRRGLPGCGLGRGSALGARIGGRGGL